MVQIPPAVPLKTLKILYNLRFVVVVRLIYFDGEAPGKHGQNLW